MPSTTTASERMQDFTHALQGDMVKIFVGMEATTPFTVPTALLTKCSRYFARLLGPDFKEGGEGIARFPADLEMPWSIFLYWLFKGEVHVPAYHVEQYWMSFAQAWLMADMYDLRTFRNELVVEFMRSLEHRNPSHDTVEEMLEIMPVDCPLRKLLAAEVVLAVEVSKKYTWDNCTSLAEHDFMVEVLKSFSDYHSKPNLFPGHEYGRNEEEVRFYMVDDHSA